MRLLGIIVLIVAVFIVVLGLAEQVAAWIPGTPTHKLAAMLITTTEADALMTALSSKAGRGLLTGHSRAILYVYLPLASLVASIVARALHVTAGLAIITVGLLVAVRIGAMAALSCIFAPITDICGKRIDSAGAAPLEAIIAFILSICLAIVTLCIVPKKILGQCHEVSGRCR